LFNHSSLDSRPSRDVDKETSISLLYSSGFYDSIGVQFEMAIFFFIDRSVSMTVLPHPIRILNPNHDRGRTVKTGMKTFIVKRRHCCYKFAKVITVRPFGLTVKTYLIGWMAT
jgi:hypothetical protein